MSYIIKNGPFYAKGWVIQPGRKQWLWTIYEEKAHVFTREHIQRGDLPDLPENVELTETDREETKE